MKQILAGYSYVLVHTTPKEQAAETGVYAYIDICYGGDDDAIANIPWRRLDSKQMAFTSPRTAIIGAAGAREVKPVFKGKLNEELCTLCTAKIFAIKKQMGSVRSGRTYRVDEAGVTEIPVKKEETCQNNSAAK